MICGLNGSMLGGTKILQDFVAMKVQDVFMPDIVVPIVSELFGLADPHRLQVKISLGAIIP